MLTRNVLISLLITEVWWRLRKQKHPKCEIVINLRNRLCCILLLYSGLLYSTIADWQRFLAPTTQMSHSAHWCWFSTTEHLQYNAPIKKSDNFATLVFFSFLSFNFAVVYKICDFITSFSLSWQSGCSLTLHSVLQLLSRVFQGEKKKRKYEPHFTPDCPKKFTPAR